LALELTWGSFLGINQLRHGVDPPPPPSAEIGVEPYLFFPLRSFMAYSRVN